MDNSSIDRDTRNLECRAGVPADEKRRSPGHIDFTGQQPGIRPGATRIDSLTRYATCIGMLLRLWVIWLFSSR